MWIIRVWRTVGVAVAVLGLASLLASAPLAGQPPAPRTLQVAMDNNYPPYVFQSADGTLQGILVDQWRLWEKKTGIAVQIHAMDWNEALRRMRAGEFDVIDTIFQSAEREAYFDFTPAYARIEVPVFFRREISGITDLESLRGFPVAAKVGDNVVDLLRAHGVTPLILFHNYASIVEAAADHRVNVFAVDAPPALYYLNKLGIAEQFRRSAPINVGEFHRAVRKGDAATLRTVEAGFAAITPDELKQIDEKWFGLSLDGGRYITYAAYAAGAALLIIVGLFAWNGVLRRMVKFRTAELQESEARLRAIIDTSPVAMAANDAEHKVTFLNRKFVELFGYTVEDIPTLAEWWSKAYPDPEYRQRAQQLWTEAVEKARREGCDLVLPDFQVRCRDGGVREVRFNAAPMGTSLLVICQDVTESKRAEAERERLQNDLLHAQKLESVGRLAGGVAHDFNNILTAIQGNVGLTLEDLPPDSPLRENLHEILRCVTRSADLTRQLLAFARKQTVVPQLVDLNATVEGMLKMLRRLIGENIELVWRPGADLKAIKIDPSQLVQVLTNLCVNARDAINGVGTVVIESRNVVVDEDYCATHPGMAPGAHVLMTVADSGAGMDREVLGHVFEPFYTTKGIGEGTGLGLATVYGIVKQNGGFIDVASTPGKGTTFSLHFPAHAAKPPGPAKEEAAPATARGRETILLVEDEPAILRVSKLALENLGYTVLAASTPGEAVRFAKEHAGKIDLLLTDVVMPEMHGRDLARLLHSQFPHLKHIFMSGYTGNLITPNGVIEDGIHFLQKPFSTKTLAEKLREVLDEDRPPA